MTGKRKAMGLKEGCNSGAGGAAQGKVQRPFPPVWVLFTFLYGTSHFFAFSCSPLAPKSTEESFYASFLQVNSKATGDCSWNLDEIAKMGYVVVRTLFLWTGNGGKFLPPSLL